MHICRFTPNLQHLRARQLNSAHCGSDWFAASAPPVLVSSRPPSPSAAVDDDAVDTSSSHDSEQLPSSQLNTPVERLEHDVQLSPPRCQDRLQVAGIQHVIRHPGHPMEWTSKTRVLPPPKEETLPLYSGIVSQAFFQVEACHLSQPRLVPLAMSRMFLTF